MASLTSAQCGNPETILSNFFTLDGLRSFGTSLLYDGLSRVVDYVAENRNCAFLKPNFRQLMKTVCEDKSSALATKNSDGIFELIGGAVKAVEDMFQGLINSAVCVGNLTENTFQRLGKEFLIGVLTGPGGIAGILALLIQRFFANLLEHLIGEL